MKLGSHVSNKGKEMLVGSLMEAQSYGSNCFMVYLGAPQNTYRKNIDEMNIEALKEACKEANISLEDVIVHAPYIVNLAQPDPIKRQFAVDFITKEVLLTHEVGAKYMVLHPGAHVGSGEEIGIELISESIKQILKNTTHTNVCIALETMAGKGSECGWKFEHIKKMIDNINSNRVAVCLDTCHINDAGYDIVNHYEKVLDEFDSVIGLAHIKVLHINDSKNEMGMRKDRHENIGFGKIGFVPLMKFIYDKRFENIPKILETPYVDDGKESYPPYRYEIEMIRKNQFDPELKEKIRKGELA